MATNWLQSDARTYKKKYKYKNTCIIFAINTRIHVFFAGHSPRGRQNCRFRQSCQDPGLITSQAMSICREESEWIPPCFHTEKARGRLRPPGLLCMKTKERTQARPLLRICEIIWRRLIGFLPSEARQEDGRRCRPQSLRNQGLRFFHCINNET